MERSQPVRFGVIGCGSIAWRSMIPGILACEKTRLTAIAARSPEVAKKAVALDCETVASYEELIARPDIDAVYIALPIGLHARWAIEAARNNKHVLCEKSLTRTLQETTEVVSACRKAGVALLEGFAYQFHTQHRSFEDLIASGAIGEPIIFQSWFGFPPLGEGHRYSPELGGGALLDAGAYTIHAARRFFRSEPVVLSADLECGERDVEIYGAAHLKFGAPGTALLGFGFNHSYRNSYSVWGTEGVATLTRAYSTPPHFAPALILERQGIREERTLTPCDQFKRELEAFCDGLEHEDIRRNWFEDAVGQAVVLEGVRKAGQTSRSGVG
jgi:dTDP-3,4-didehydro-2,6-dideoxy-alpha-D-glucose 3-reductase